MTDTDTGGYQAAFEQVQRLLNAGDFEQALEQVDLILQVHPRDVKSAYARVVILRRLGQHDASVALLERLVQGTQGVPAVYEEYGMHWTVTEAEMTVPKTLFVVMDGIPTDVIERVATPNLDQITASGGFGRAYVGGETGGASESPTISAVGYQSLLTGTWANKHQVFDNEVASPNYAYWDIFRMAKTHAPGLSTALFSTWEDNRTKLIGDGLAAAGGYKLDYYLDGLEHDVARFPKDRAATNIKAIDGYLAEQAAEYLLAKGPDLSWVYFQYTDDVGHRVGDSPEMDAAVSFTDGLVGTLWAAIEARQKTLDEDWLIVVTTDHGRDALNGKGHGGQSERERSTWIATNSDCLADRFYATPAIVDIVPSILAHMHIQVPDTIRAALDGSSFLTC